MKYLRFILIILLLFSTAFFALSVYKSEQEKGLLKKDLIELSNIKYGLFSVDEWKKILANIITKKITEFNLEGANRDKARIELTTFLYKQIDEFETRTREENSKSIFGMLVKNPLASVGGFFDKLRDGVPRITDEILNYLNDKKNRRVIRAYIINKLDEYTDKTFSKIDYSTYNEILLRHGFEDKETALTSLKTKILTLENSNGLFQIGLVLLGTISGLVLLFSKNVSTNEYRTLTIICFIFLITGLLLPMIEIDARIAEMSFNLLGEPVTFQDQVLYFKSKSILEVVRLMLTQRRFDLMFVGILVLTFSVLFPVAKLISSLLYLKNEDLKSNRFIQFMIFKTGKWSMADVMVIAIFMAYIGFSGIITEQLKQLEKLTLNFDILTTNKSSLMFGFYSFTSFAVLSLLISHKLQFDSPKNKKS